MACVTACPSGVQYDKLLEDARAQIERNFERPPAERAHRWLVFELFTRPGRLRASAPGLALARALGLDAIVRRPRVRRRLPKLASLMALAPDTPFRIPSSGCPSTSRRAARGAGLSRSSRGAYSACSSGT